MKPHEIIKAQQDEIAALRQELATQDLIVAALQSIRVEPVMAAEPRTLRFGEGRQLTHATGVGGIYPALNRRCGLESISNILQRNTAGKHT